MKYRVWLLIIAMAYNYAIQGQSWNWVKAINEGVEEIGDGLGIDEANNLYVVGSTSYFTGGNGSFYYPLLYKFNSSGNVVWKDTLATNPQNIATDSLGNSYLARAHWIMKYDSAGNQLWFKTVTEVINNICLAPFGFVVVGFTYDSTKCVSVLNGYDHSGQLLWSRKGDFGAGGAVPNSIVCNTKGETYWVGPDFVNNVKVGFLAKIDSMGNLLISRWLSEIPIDVALSPKGDVYTTGYIYINATTANPPFYIAQYDQKGNKIWLSQINGIFDYPNFAISADNTGNIFLTSSFKELHAGNINISAVHYDAFILKVDYSGNFDWIVTSEGKNNQSYAGPRDIQIDHIGNIYITGCGSDTSKFEAATVNFGWYPDILLAKISQTSSTSVSEFPNAFNVIVYPNPTSGIFQLEYLSNEKSEIEMCINDIHGKLICTETFEKPAGTCKREVDLTGYAKGIYIIGITDRKKKITQKIIIQ